MFDLDLLRTFVSVVDAGGFTRAGERVRRTQSTISQQVRRLEESAGHALLERGGREIVPTEQGELLLAYARRILALSAEARDMLSRPTAEATLRLGIPEDFAATRLARLLSDFARAHPRLRLDVRCDLSVVLREAVERDELDIALIKQEAGDRSCLASWPERIVWAAAGGFALDPLAPVPLVVFQHGCVYRKRAIHTLEAEGRGWRVAYSSPNLMGVQAAVASGLGVGVLSDSALLAGMRVLGAAEGMPALPATELALISRRPISVASRRLIDHLTAFCDAGLGEEAA